MLTHSGRLKKVSEFKKAKFWLFTHSFIHLSSFFFPSFFRGCECCPRLPVAKFLHADEMLKRTRLEGDAFKGKDVTGLGE